MALKFQFLVALEYLRSLSSCHFNPEENFLGQIWHSTEYLNYLEIPLLIIQVLLWLECVH